MTLPVHEIFASLQGEGRHTGRPCLFIRFAGCNLACPWCDTDHAPRLALTVDDLLARVDACGAKNVILTGGEPLLHPLLPLAQGLRARGCWVAVETNATIEPEPALRAALSYIAASPKVGAPIALTRADEVRLVVADGVGQAWCEAVRTRLPAADYYLSPCDDGTRLRIREAIALLGRLNAADPTPPWRLSLQTHKLAGIP